MLLLIHYIFNILFFLQEEENANHPNQTVNGGNAVDQAIPFYNAQQYYYNLVATDACGNVYTLNNNPVNRKFDATIIVNKLDCFNKQIEISPSFFFL